MKSKLLLLLLCFTVAASAKTATIKGKINGKLPNNLYYTAPVNGALGFNLYYTAKVDATGNFEIKADLPETTFIDIYYNYQPAGAIIATPGSIYNITITESEGKVAHTITGASEVQKWYSSIINDHRESLFINLSMNLVKLETPLAITQEIKTLENADVAALTKLHEAKAISTDLYNILLHERSYFYAASVAYAILVKHIYTEREPAERDLSEYDRLWKNIYTSQSPADALVSKSPWGTYFLEGYKNYKVYELVKFDGRYIEQLNEFEIMKRNRTFMIEPNAEYFYATTLFNGIFGDRKDKITITAFNYFKEQYPKSGYTKYLEPMVAEVVTFFNANASLPQGAAYINDYSNLNSFDELLKKFPNKKLYFDVWATWCGSCREEFKYKEALYKLLKANNIEVVYISVDRDDKDETWKKMISHYGLVGYHLRANKALDTDLGKIGISNYPWYMLSNNGNVSIPHAAPPSDIGNLEQQIKKM